MSRAHTPGPWKVVNDKRWGLGVDAANNPHGDRFSFSIVEMGHVGGDHRGKDATGGTPEANARLIAAAPELLAAADFALANLRRNLASEEACGSPFMGDDEHEAIRLLTDAIAKAVQPMNPNMPSSGRVDVGDIVRVDFNNSQMTLAHRAEVVHIPCATGDSWIFRNVDTGAVHYVSEGCTITKEPQS